MYETANILISFHVQIMKYLGFFLQRNQIPCPAALSMDGRMLAFSLCSILHHNSLVAMVTSNDIGTIMCLLPLVTIVKCPLEAQ